ncbi:hypothetical protein DPMN_147370 [Dreissena polymorpha]|uniref:Uncharacterized protein n=1 Tax=Dreissena polymorpha TaxID=45954 RepID=A0A9D4J2Y1_DREPO|nr:hypothetical protein DPMN_147370 [Dreissena polymorpha]
MVQYPFNVCSEQCSDGSIQCHNCKKWSHRQYYDMSDTDLKSWSPSYLKFVCQKCGFRNGKYDVEAALKSSHVQ